MSCESLRKKLLQLKPQLSEESEDALLAGKFAHYLEEECEQQPTSTSFLIFRHTIGLTMTDKERKEAAAEILENWKKDAQIFLKKHGVEV